MNGAQLVVLPATMNELQHTNTHVFWLEYGNHHVVFGHNTVAVVVHFLVATARYDKSGIYV